MFFFSLQVEIKNLNAFSAMSRAIDYEITRQALLYNQGQADKIVTETRLWDEGAQVSFITLQYLLFYSATNFEYIYMFRKQ